MDITLRVNLIKEKYIWEVNVITFDHLRYSIKGEELDGLKACLKAEETGDNELTLLLPDWIKTALANKWRPPCRIKLLY